MSISRQSALGALLLFGGSVMLFAMLQQSEPTESNSTQEAQQLEVEQNEVTLTAVESGNNTLTTDIATEEKILEEKQKQREDRVRSQEEKAQAFMKQQEQAAADALASTRSENQQFHEVAESEESESTSDAAAQEESTASDIIVKPEVNTRVIRSEPKTIIESSNKSEKNTDSAKSISTEDKRSKETTTSDKVSKSVKTKSPPAKPITYYAKKGDGLIQISKEYNIPLEILAEANDMHILDDLMYNQKLVIPSKSQLAKLQSTAQKKQAERQAEINAKKEAEQKKALEKQKARKAAEQKEKEQAKQAQKSRQATRDAQKKLNEARKTVRQENAKGTFGVQVALASDQTNADEIAKKFRSAGYKTKTSQTSRGVRVIVGPERGKAAALALKDKINTDPKVKTSNAWVLYWR